MPLKTSAIGLSVMTMATCLLWQASGLPECRESFEQNNLLVMSFNIWNSGSNVENGIFKIAKHILYNNPDIVAIQELMTDGYMMSIIRQLGPGWVGVAANSSYPDVAIFTRHNIVAWSDWTAEEHASPVGYIWAKIQVSSPNGSYPVHFWSVHLDWRDYGPYAACNKLVTRADQIDAGEWGRGRSNYGRAQQAYMIVNSVPFQLHRAESGRIPFILAGDFNSPSHLDWTVETMRDHCDWAYAWPTTLLMIGSGLRDAYRELYTNPKTYPGFTWSTVKKAGDGWNGTIPEPQERVDMVLYISPSWRPRQVVVYSGHRMIKPSPDHWYNDWPSDHYAVLALFSNANPTYFGANNVISV